MTYVNMSLFFAFATLYPDMRVLLFFIIPIKIKWLAWIDAALFAWSILSSLFGVFTAGLAALPGVVLPLVAIPQLLHLLLGQLPPALRPGEVPHLPPDGQLQAGNQESPSAEGLHPQVRRLRQDRHRLPQRGVPLLLQVQRLLLLLHEAHQ